MTGQSLLDLMEVLDNELQNQSGEEDVARALVALNAAQDHFEAIVATQANLLGDTVGTITTTASTETTTFPTGLLRLDKLQYIDPVTSRPAWDVIVRRQTGGHSVATYWPWNLLVTSSQIGGKPQFFYTNGRSIYWSPLPDATHTVRWYGFQAASDITASGTFAYPDIVALPLASFATRLLSMGVSDETSDLGGLAAQTFLGTIKALEQFNRAGPQPMTYRFNHLA